MRTRLAFVGSFAAVGCLLAVGAPAALGASVDRSAGTLTITGSPGEESELVVTVTGTTVMVGDAGGASVSAGAGCATVDESNLSCGNADALTSITAGLADGDDVLRVQWPSDPSPPTVDADGGPGDDELLSAAGDSRLVGGDGADTLGGVHECCEARFEGGNDTLIGGPGGDQFYGGQGNDSIDGGPGTDGADFVKAPTGVTVNLPQGTATGDGSDNLTGVEDVEGSDGNDTIIGDGHGNFIVARKGNDRIKTGGGNDWVNAGRGNDKLNGGRGKDTLQGYENNDTINARDGQKDKLVSGGTGTDRAKIDRADRRNTKGVEKIR